MEKRKQNDKRRDKAEQNRRDAKRAGNEKPGSQEGDVCQSPKMAAPKQVLSANARVEIQCMLCGKEFNLREEAEWKNVKCPGCGELGQLRFI